MPKKREYPPRSIVDPMLEWEKTMYPLAGENFRCSVALLRLQQTLEMFPWLESRLRPIINDIIKVRDGIEGAQERAFLYWNGDFWEPLQELGFKNPETYRMIEK